MYKHPILLFITFSVMALVQTTFIPVAREQPVEMAKVYHGNGYWFEQHGHAGACGKVHRDTDLIVALQTSNYAKGRHCGRKVQITDKTTKKNVVAVVADLCPSCPGVDDLDMSTELFTRFAKKGVGKLNVQWKFIT